MKGDNAKSKKGRVVILVCDTSSCPVLHFYEAPSKYSKAYLSYRADTNLFQTKQREITAKVRKTELSFLYKTLHLILFYISTKYHQTISKGIQVIEHRRRFMQTPMLTGSVPKTICPHLPPNPTQLVMGVGGGESIPFLKFLDKPETPPPLSMKQLCF